MWRSLEVLRIFSACLVVMAHLSPTTLPLMSFVLGGKLFLGSIGVDIFFIISGVVMGLAVKKRIGIVEVGQRVQGFLVSRIFKIFPLYIISTIFIVIVSPYFKKTQPAFERILIDLMLLPRMENGIYVDPIIGIGWTLRYEFFFYLLVFVGLLTNQRHFATVLIIIIVAIPITAWSYYSNPILLEFLAGYLLSFYMGQLARFSDVYLNLGLLTLALVVFAAASTGKDFQPGEHDANQIPRMLIYFGDYSFPRVLAWGLPAMLLTIATVLLENQMPGRIVSLGKYTYSLYLMQYFCLPLRSKLLARGWPDYAALPTTLLFLATATVLSYLYVEKPFSLVPRYLQWNRRGT